MKRILLSFLVLILLNIVETEPSEFAKRLGKALIMMKKLKEEYKLRKLQEATDSTEDDTNTEKISTNTSAPIQIFDFYDYKPDTASNGKISFTFKVLFYFLIPIPDTVMLPLKVTTGSLRQLQSGEQEIYATCTPSDSTESDEDEQGGRSKEFTCSGEAEGSSISNVKYDDSRLIKAIKDGVTTPYPGGDVYFADGAQANKDQIDKAPNYAGVFVLKNGFVENTDENDGKFDIKGAMNKDIKSINNQNLDLAISTSQNLTCTVSGSTDSSVITCDTNKESMPETDLHGKSGISSVDGSDYKVYLTMINGNSTIKEGEYEAATSPTYRKSSSGLSGGAIAGIVIACVVVLIAAAVAAIMLRKPTPPPVDNTTVTGLQTVENM